MHTGEQGGGNTARIYEFALYGHVKDESGVDHVSVSATAGGIELLGNYPNPCHGEAEVRYRVPEGTSALSLEVYDMAGKALQNISLPVNDGNAGEYSSHVSFALGEGLYLYRITGICAGAKVQSVSKRLLIK